MDSTLLVLLYACLPLLAIFLIISKNLTTSPHHHNLPPTPATPLPILGHLHLLHLPLHRTLQRFSQSHGHIFTLKLGVRRVVVISSPALVHECFTKNDVVFSNRPRILSQKYIGYDYTTMAGAPYGPNWHALRRLAAQELRLNSFSQIRQDEVKQFLLGLIMDRNAGEKFELRPKLFELVFGIIMRMLTGKRYGGGNENEKFAEMVREVFQSSQTSNPEDFVPVLEWIDYRGLKKKLSDLGKRLDDFYQGLLEEHRIGKEEEKSTEKPDPNPALDSISMIGHLISLQRTEPEFYTDQIIKGFITNMIIAGTDTAIVTIEWAMSLLLNHPQVIENARQELDEQVGTNKLVHEQDLSNLHCLQRIVLETLRLFPPGPLIVPREASADCKLGGYDMPRGTILIVNAWAIHRDPEVWDDANSFKPERFEGGVVETNKLMPFGVGRRACPGASLGQRMVELALGSLIQCFEWEKVSSEDIDLAEGAGLTMPKVKPLEVICRPREIMLEVLNPKQKLMAKV